MSELPKSNSPESEPSNPPQSEHSNNNGEKENLASSNPIKEFLKNFQSNETAKNIEEIWQGLGAANVFIDARSGGAYFASETKVTGDVVGCSQSKRTLSATGYYAEDIAGTILSADVNKIRRVYVETSNYSDAQHTLNNKHILILSGDSHFGKRTTAINLLFPFSQTEEILEIDPTLGEEDLKTFGAEAKQVYLIDTLTPDSASKLYKFALDNLGQRLREKNSYLIITVDIRAQLSQELSQYTLQWKQLPDSNTLLEKHLAWYLENQDTNIIQELIQQESVCKIVENKLLPGEVDRLAELLAKVFKNELSLEQALASFSGQVKQQVEIWFDQEQNLSQCVFMIALAVLSGSKYQAVINASQSLQSLIEPHLEKEKTSNSESAFNKKRSERLKEVNAHLTQGYENTNFGRSPVELVELDNPVFQPAILAYVWDEYDFYRDKLLQWLHNLGTHPDFEVRIRAAAAAGELSKYAFKDVLDQVIQPWANSQQQSVQKLASLALSVPVFEGYLAPQVLKLLHDWSGLNNNPRLCWTAAAAYGSYVGLRFPDIAVRDLFKIAQSGDTNLILAVAESITILFESGKFVPNQYFIILNALQDWTRTSLPKGNLPHQLGLFIVWILMCKAKVPGDSNQGYRPTLLQLSIEDRIYENIIIRLLRLSLNQKKLNSIEGFPLRKQVLEEIYRWLQLVDDDPQLYPILGSIIFKLVFQGDEREQSRILDKLESWTGKSKAASKIFEKICKELKI